MIGKRYADFFREHGTERHLFLCGGRRSRKTWTTFEYYYWLLGLMGNQTITVLTHQFPQLQATMRDFENCMNECVKVPVKIRGSYKDGYSTTTQGNVKWIFTHCDDKVKAQGTSSDFCFANESLNIPDEVMDVYNLGIKQQLIYNYNPTKRYTYGEKHQNGNNLLCTTFKDNPYLTPAQIAEFENYKLRAQAPNATRWDEYVYQVYYLGNFYDMAGSVFTNLESCTYDTYRNIPALESIAIDFGFATDGDPTACVGVKIHNQKIYCHQYIYEQGLTSAADIADRLLACGFNYATMIFGDYGGQGRSRMDELIAGMSNGIPFAGEASKGFNIANAVKNKTVMEGLSTMLSYDAIVFTDTSKALRAELEEYELDENNKPHGADHAIDCVRYNVNYLRHIL